MSTSFNLDQRFPCQSYALQLHHSHKRCLSYMFLFPDPADICTYANLIIISNCLHKFIGLNESIGGKAE